MALKAGYYGLKRSLLNKVKALPRIKSIGAGLSLNSTTGELEATGTTVSIEANPEGVATDNLVKLGIGDDVYAVPDASKTYQTDDATETAIVDADYIPFFDKSAASGDGAPKKSTWTNFIAKIKAKITEYVTWAANNVLGAKNMFVFPYYDGSTKTTNGVTFTVNSDGSVTVDTAGQASTGDATFRLMRYDRDQHVLDMLDGKTVIMNGSSSNAFVALFNGSESVVDDGSGTHVNVSSDITNWNFYIFVPSGRTCNNEKVYPMLSFDGGEYAPYAMTNRELTEIKLTKNPTVLSSSDDLDNIKETGFYYITTTPTHAPDSRSYSALQVIKRTSDDIMQMLFTPTRMYLRHFSSGVWQSWYKFEGTEVTS